MEIAAVNSSEIGTTVSRQGRSMILSLLCSWETKMEQPVQWGILDLNTASLSSQYLCHEAALTPLLVTSATP